MVLCSMQNSITHESFLGVNKDMTGQMSCTVRLPSAVVTAGISFPNFVFGQQGLERIILQVGVV
jgi:hypothetical protein